ncbi:hypothetical protein BKA69DRAFT_1063620 [Paraphysoderma sedebokerense]|nr:hypothetical protein BKA69DRAFT_1063620 [Paraphysoderma sedebokerense]
MILLFILISVLVFLPASVILFLFYQHLRSQYLFNKYNTPTPIGETPKFPLGNYDFSKEDHEWQLAWAKKFGSVLRFEITLSIIICDRGNY